MKTLKYFILSIFIINAILFITSCDDKFLDISPRTEFSEIDVWGDPVLAEAFVNNLYRRFGNPLNQRTTSVFCDEAHRRSWGSSRNFNSGRVSPDNLQGWTDSRAHQYWDWTQLYKSIRATNIFFENIERVNFEGDQDFKNRLTGEVHFSRAWYYFYLLRMYGGVPLITKSYGLNDEYEVPRETFEDVIEFIVEDLDKAAFLLPQVHSNAHDGRATKGAALSLKSTVLIAAASDLYNTTVFSEYSNPELIGYEDKSINSRNNRWRRAKDAAKAVMDMSLYDLYQGANDSVAVNFVEYFSSRSRRNPEDILVRYLVEEQETNAGRSNTPVGWRGQGNMCPTGQMVDSYEMKDGSRFDWKNPDHAANPWANRDPRFYADILYEGAYWQPRQPIYQGIDPIGIVQLGTWERWDTQNNKMYLEHGLDGRKGSASPFEASETNYYSRKFLDQNIYHGANYQPITWRWIRYTEILFNYAEACIELGEDEEARTYLNKIRDRADMPHFTESGNDLRKRFRNEKKIEMFLEHQRFWDLRRWLIGTEAYKPTMKVEVYYPLLPDKTTSIAPKITPIEISETRRKWFDYMYFFPIYRDEMTRNSMLIQNPGY